VTRTEFIKWILWGGFSLGLSSSLYSIFSGTGKSKRELGTTIRPPGAIAEGDFDRACIRCGQCAQKCPHDAILIAQGGNGISAGTPYLDLRQKPCYLCHDFPCVKACPTDALNRNLNDVKQVAMGTAVITDREACLSLRGLRCEVCYHNCPLIDKAITISKHRNPVTSVHTIFEPVVHKEHCVGCGICEHKCVLDKPAIVVVTSISADKSKHYLKPGKVKNG